MRRGSVREHETLTSQFFIKADIAPTTALSGGHGSEDSLAISTAILNAAYAVFPVSPIPRTVALSLDVSRASLKAELMERAIADDVAPSVVRSFRDVSCRTSSAEGAGVGARVSPDGLDLRK